MLAALSRKHIANAGRLGSGPVLGPQAAGNTTVQDQLVLLLRCTSRAQRGAHFSSGSIATSSARPCGARP